MEGLTLARTLARLQEHLPARALGWMFPDETSAALLLEGAHGTTNLVLNYRPPHPVLYLSRERLRGEAHNAFQRFVAARLRGTLTHTEQLKLDRVLQLHFSGEAGFVDVPPARLLFEVTGRNTNVLVLEEHQQAGDWEGRILIAAREITQSRNRFRTIRSGGRYTPPPPYQKFDPRNMTADEARSLADLPLSRWRDQIDGLGPSLSAELVRRAGFADSPKERWPAAWQALQGLVADPSIQESVLSLNEASREAARAEKAAQLRKALREPLNKRLTLLTHQLGDVDRATLGLQEAQHERQEADLLMAYAHTVEAGALSVSLSDFAGEGEVTVALDPALSAIQNAEKRYSRARRREEVFDRLAEREGQLRSDYAEVEQRLRELDQASLSELEALERQLISEQPVRSSYGARYQTPSGLEVLVGRNNKENATLTHRLGRSQDYWFHAQGYPGSHVLVRSGARELDLPDILFAAKLAAKHSKASGGGTVAVDYTRIKYVWRPKGAPTGQVHYTQQKTVYVDPVDRE